VATICHPARKKEVELAKIITQLSYQAMQIIEKNTISNFFNQLYYLSIYQARFFGLTMIENHSVLHFANLHSANSDAFIIQACSFILKKNHRLSVNGARATDL